MYIHSKCFKVPVQTGAHSVTAFTPSSQSTQTNISIIHCPYSTVTWNFELYYRCKKKKKQQKIKKIRVEVVTAVPSTYVHVSFLSENSLGRCKFLFILFYPISKPFLQELNWQHFRDILPSINIMPFRKLNFKLMHISLAFSLKKYNVHAKQKTLLHSIYRCPENFAQWCKRGSHLYSGFILPLSYTDPTLIYRLDD